MISDVQIKYLANDVMIILIKIQNQAFYIQIKK